MQDISQAELDLLIRSARDDYDNGRYADANHKLKYFIEYHLAMRDTIPLTETQERHLKAAQFLIELTTAIMTPIDLTKPYWSGEPLCEENLHLVANEGRRLAELGRFAESADLADKIIHWYMDLKTTLRTKEAADGVQRVIDSMILLRDDLRIRDQATRLLKKRPSDDV